VTRPWDGDDFQPPDNDVSRAIQSLLGTPTPTKRLDDADVVKLAGRDWVAVHTPGHTPDHLCLFDPAEGLMLSGDHVLPSITPHISGIGNADDPLAEYFASLELMGTFDGVTQALPAHGHPFADLAGRAAGIRQHHEERLDILRAASADIGRPASVEELMQRLFSPRAWGQMAASETYAHLEHLRLSGAAHTRRDGDILLYDVVA
jgi:glyoxylase-like metal-dependent hydrolase (beta-lactamase superfamily II)